MTVTVWCNDEPSRVYENVIDIKAWNGGVVITSLDNGQVRNKVDLDENTRIEISM